MQFQLLNHLSGLDKKAAFFFHAFVSLFYYQKKKKINEACSLK